MRIALPRLTIFRLMIAVGCAGVTLSVARWAPALAGLLGVPLFLAMVRTFAAIDRAVAMGATVPASRKAYAFAASFVVAGFIVLESLTAFVCVAGMTFGIVGGLIDLSQTTSFMVVTGLLALVPAVIAAWKLARTMAAVMWPCDLTKPTDGIWTAPDFADPSLDPPPDGRVESARAAEGLDRTAEASGITWITGGGTESGEA